MGGSGASWDPAKAHAASIHRSARTPSNAFRRARFGISAHVSSVTHRWRRSTRCGLHVRRIRMLNRSPETSRRGTTSCMPCRKTWAPIRTCAAASTPDTESFSEPRWVRPMNCPFICNRLTRAQTTAGDGQGKVDAAWFISTRPAKRTASTVRKTWEIAEIRTRISAPTSASSRTENSAPSARTCFRVRFTIWAQASLQRSCRAKRLRRLRPTSMSAAAFCWRATTILCSTMPCWSNRPSTGFPGLCAAATSCRTFNWCGADLLKAVRRDEPTTSRNHQLVCGLTAREIRWR